MGGRGNEQTEYVKNAFGRSSGKRAFPNGQWLQTGQLPVALSHATPDTVLPGQNDDLPREIMMEQ